MSGIHMWQRQFTVPGVKFLPHLSFVPLNYVATRRASSNLDAMAQVLQLHLDHISFHLELWMLASYQKSACQNLHGIFLSLLTKYILLYVSILISFSRLLHCQNHSDDMLLGWKHNCVLFISCSPLFWAISLFNTTTTHRAFQLNVKQY